MDHQWTKSLREDNKYRGHRSKNPSFSSSLLDAIYRSIDEGEEEFVHYKETPKKKQVKMAEEIQENDDFRRACLIEKWMETKASEKVVKCKSVPDLNPNIKKQKQSNNNSNSIRYSGSGNGNGNGFHSASSSSDSSSGGFSSSEAESLYGSHRPKPIRTSFSAKAEKLDRPLPSQRRSESSMYETRQQLQHHLQQQQAKQEKISGTHKQKHEGGAAAGGFNKTKTKAMKIYGELKKAKQPISPGGRLASFLNSLFTAGNAKKEKLSSSVNGIDDYRSERKTKSAQTSTCSSASSFSRSCLSKTPSSRGKPTDGAKRSVRFYPVSVIVDEDSRPCGHKSLHEQQQMQPQLQKPKPKTTNSANEELKQLRVLEKNRRIEEAAREFLRDYQKKKIDVEMRDASRDYQDEDDDDDAESCTSSDLFELDNLAAIGIDRYREELPVYETTHLQKNRAISKGFIM